MMVYFEIECGLYIQVNQKKKTYWDNVVSYLNKIVVVYE